MPTTHSAPLARRRAQSGRVRGLAHLVPPTAAPVSGGLSTKALCGFQPKRYWSAYEAPRWEDTCRSCEVKAGLVDAAP